MSGSGCTSAWVMPDARSVPYRDASESGATAGLGAAADCTACCDHAVVAPHPVRQDVIDSRAFDRSGTAAGQLKRIALPQKIRGRPDRNRYRLAGFAAADLHHLAVVNKWIAPRPFQPLVQQAARVSASRAAFGSIDGAIDDVEEGVLMRCRVIRAQSDTRPDCRRCPGAGSDCRKSCSPG